jgi:hypothetical protein
MKKIIFSIAALLTLMLLAAGCLATTDECGNDCGYPPPEPVVTETHDTNFYYVEKRLKFYSLYQMTSC